MSRVRSVPTGTGRTGGQEHGDALPRSRKGDLLTDPYDEEELQLQRLQEYLVKSLADPQPEIAMLGATNAGLLKTMFLLSKSMEEVTLECPSASLRYETLLRGIEILVRVTRQFDRLEHLKLLLTNAHQAAGKLKRRASLGEESKI